MSRYSEERIEELAEKHLNLAKEKAHEFECGLKASSHEIYGDISPYIRKVIVEDNKILLLDSFYINLVKEMEENKRSDEDFLRERFEELDISGQRALRIIHRLRDLGFMEKLKELYGDTTPQVRHYPRHILEKELEKKEELIEGFSIVERSHLKKYYQGTSNSLELEGVHLVNTREANTLKKLIEWHEQKPLKIICGTSVWEAAFCLEFEPSHIIRHLEEGTLQSLAEAVDTEYVLGYSPKWEPYEEYLEKNITLSKRESQKVNSNLILFDGFFRKEGYTEAYNKLGVFPIPKRYWPIVKDLIKKRDVKEDTVRATTRAHFFPNKHMPNFSKYLRTLERSGVLNEIDWIQKHKYGDRLITRNHYRVLQEIGNRFTKSLDLAKELKIDVKEFHDVLNFLRKIKFIKPDKGNWKLTIYSENYFAQIAERESKQL